MIRAVRLLQTLQSHNASLREEASKLERDLEELKRENQEKSELINRFENDRLKIRSHVERAIKRVAVLEEPVRESI